MNTWTIVLIVAVIALIALIAWALAARARRRRQAGSSMGLPPLGAMSSENTSVGSAEADHARADQPTRAVGQFDQRSR